MTEIRRIRDKFFWICLGFGSVVSVYFLYRYFINDNRDLSAFTNYSYKKQFSVYVPFYLLPADSIYERSALEFSDYAQEVFLVVVNEKKDELRDQGLMPSLAEYSDYVRSSIENALKESTVTDEKNTVINGIPSITRELEGRYGNTYVYYIFTVYESATDFYQMICWTTADLKPNVKKDIYTAMQSFTIP